LRKVKVAVIGGTSLEALLTGEEQIRVGTPYGLAPPISVGNVDGKSVVFLPRHGLHHSVPPHVVDYRTNVYALYKLGVKRIIATNAVGAINRRFKVGVLLYLMISLISLSFDNLPTTVIPQLLILTFLSHTVLKYALY